jgi:CRP-like cAMP-binding protein
MGKCEQCIVRQLNSLKTLSKEELGRLSTCKADRVIKKGEHIFEEGEHLNGVYCVKSGVCKLVKLSPNGKDQIVKLNTSGDLLGQRSTLSNEPANLSAVAITDMEVCFIPQTEILKAVGDNPNFTVDMFKTLGKSIRESDDLLVNMSQKSMRERLAATLIMLEESYGKEKDGTLSLVLTREEFAGIVGTATESVIRLLSQLNKEKLIHIEGRHISILDIEKLRRISEGV